MFGVVFFIQYSDVMNLFEGDDMSKMHVNMLTGVGVRASIEDKWYMHIYY